MQNNNSAEAYKNCNRKTNGDKIYAHILFNRGVTAQEMVKPLDLPINVISGRVNTLKKQGHIRVIGKMTVTINNIEYHRDMYAVVTGAEKQDNQDKMF